MATFGRVSLGFSLALVVIGCGGGNGTQKSDGGLGGGQGGRGGAGAGGGAGVGGRGGSGAVGAGGQGGGGGSAGAAGTSPGGAGGTAGAVGTAGAGGSSPGGAGGGAGVGGVGGSAPVAGAGGGGIAGGSAGTGGVGGGIAGGGGSAVGGVGGSGCTTSVSGTIFDPAGTAPIYRAHVYAPTTTLDAVPEGISCTACGAPESGHPIADAVTDTQGRFKLEGVPPGSNVPLVIQLGKWRRQITVPTVAACTDTALTDTTLTRLPRDSSEGHLPRIAVSTGGSSAIECWLRRLGISDSEFSSGTGSGRVHLFAGGDQSTGQGSGATQLASGEMFTDAYASLFASPTKLASYDMVLLGCEGGQYSTAKTPYTSNIKAYADGGGRILAEHLQFYWFRSGPAPWPSTATWGSPMSDLSNPVTAFIDISSAEGMAARSWMTGLGAASNGQLSVYGAQHSVESVVAPTKQWLVVPATSVPTQIASATLMLSFATPVEATSGPQCGRVDFSDMHTSIAGNSDPLIPFPTGCKSDPPSAQERMLEYRFFDTPTCAPTAP